MAVVIDADLIDDIKSRLGIIGDYQDDLLLNYANDCKDYMRSAGVDSDLIDDEICVGAIARGVADLWNLASGDGKFSEIFLQRVIQLTMEASDNVD